MKFYNITKGQMITVWAFGFSLSISGNESGDKYITFFAIPILFFIVFYSIGWINYQKNKSN